MGSKVANTFLTALFLTTVLLVGTARSQTVNRLKSVVVASDRRDDIVQQRWTVAGPIANAEKLKPSGDLFLGARLVNVTVSVTDSDGNAVNGLSRDQFEVFDNDVRQQIAHFSDDDVPLSFGIVSDFSVPLKKLLDGSFGH